MLSIGIFVFAVVLPLIAAFFILIVELRSAKVAYLSVAWSPLALLLFIYFGRELFIEEFGFGGILFIPWMVVSSLMLGALGIILLTRIARRGEPSGAVAVLTVTAFAPALIYLLLLLAKIAVD